MLATISTARPAVGRIVARAAASHMPMRVARPITVGVRAYKEDEAREVQKQQEKAVAKPQQQQQDAMAVRAPHPAMRLPSLFNEMQREMDAMTRMFGLPSLLDDDMFTMPFSRAAPRLLRDMPSLPTMHLATDILEDDKAFTIKADCPGMSKENIKVSVLDGTLTISGERREEKTEGGEEAGEGGEGGTNKPAPVRFERSYGSFRRSFSLPPNVDVEGIQATAKDGVLTLTLPKVPEQAPQPKEVPVE